MTVQAWIAQGSAHRCVQEMQLQMRVQTAVGEYGVRVFRGDLGRIKCGFDLLLGTFQEYEILILRSNQIY